MLNNILGFFLQRHITWGDGEIVYDFLTPYILYICIILFNIRFKVVL
jgi:hypothetical protein